MPLQRGGSAPYAPASTVLSLIERARTRGLPTPVTKDVLLRSGVSESLVPRTLQALQLLELIKDDGAWTQNLETLRSVPEPEFQERLADIIRSVYEDVFKFVDPSKDNQTAVRDAFRGYTPHGQQERMIPLFLALCKKAGIVNAESAQRAPREPRQAKKLQKRPITSTTDLPQQKKLQSNLGLPAPLAGLLTALPSEGSGWSQESRDRFYNTFGTLLDFCFPIRDMENDEPEGEVP